MLDKPNEFWYIFSENSKLKEENRSSAIVGNRVAHHLNTQISLYIINCLPFQCISRSWIVTVLAGTLIYFYCFIILGAWELHNKT